MVVEVQYCHIIHIFKLLESYWKLLWRKYRWVWPLLKKIEMIKHKNAISKDSRTAILSHYFWHIYYQTIHIFNFSQSMSSTGNCKQSLNEQSYLPDMTHLCLVNLGLTLLPLGFTTLLTFILKTNDITYYMQWIV
jgi:hypothetical protein